MLREKPRYNSNHTAGIGLSLRLPALVYSLTGNEEYLQASQRRIEALRKQSVQVTGSPATAAEFLAPVGATMETEYCSYAFWNAAYAYMGYITGEAKYGDYMEELFYNGAQGARKKDERAITYLNAPNQVYATAVSSNSAGDMQVYAPCYPVSCCPVNAVAVVPEFIRGMLLHDAQDNLYVMAYGPCSLRYKDIFLREETMYPFRNTVRFVMECSASFRLYLRIPEWADGYTVHINGAPARDRPAGEGFVMVERAWRPGDTVEIRFQTNVRILTLQDADAAGKFPLAVKYGALVYACHVPEQWTAIAGRPMTPLPDGWSWYEVNPEFEQPDIPDIHERNGKLRDAFSWNVALDERISAADFTVELRDSEGYVWEDAPIRLHTYCYKAPDLWAPYQTKTLEPYGNYQYVTERLPLVLEPYGCTNLRITYFPRADPACLEKTEREDNRPCKQ